MMRTLGLFAAIPAAVAYNYFGHMLKESARMDDFSIEFLNMAERSFEVIVAFSTTVTESRAWPLPACGTLSKSTSRVRGRAACAAHHLHAHGARDGVRHRCGCAGGEDDQRYYQGLPIVTITKDPEVYLVRGRININEIASTVQKRYGRARRFTFAPTSGSFEIVAQVLAELGAAKIGVSVVTKPEDITRGHADAYADAFDQREPLGKPFWIAGAARRRRRVAGRGHFISVARRSDGVRRNRGAVPLWSIRRGIPMCSLRPCEPRRERHRIAGPQAPPKPKAAVREKAPERTPSTQEQDSFEEALT